MPIDAVSCSRKARCDAVNSFSVASSITAFTRSSNNTGSTITLRGTASNSPERTARVFGGRSSISMRRFSRAHCPINPSPIATRSSCPSALLAYAESSIIVVLSSESVW